MNQVNGLVFQVTEASGGIPDLVVKEWYSAVLTKIEQKVAPFGPCLEWFFELQGDEYSYEKDGEIKQRTVRGTTSLICSINPETGKASKMYSWYCILAGEKVEQGVNVDLGNIIGAECRIMVGEAKAGKKEGSSFQNVVDVNLPAAQPKVVARPAVAKPVATKPVAASVIKPAVKIAPKPAAPKTPLKLDVPNPDGVEDPSEIGDVFEDL